MILILGSGVIATEISACFKSAGKDVVMTSTSLSKLSANNIVGFDCRVDRLCDVIDSESIDFIVNCAYSFSDNEINDAINNSLVNYRQSNKHVKCINISTMSAYAGARSQYGRAKYKQELFFESYSIPSVRIGLPYSNAPVGLIGVVKKLSKIFPVYAFAISTPGAYTFITPMEELSSFLLNHHSNLKGVCSYVEPTPVDLVDLTRMCTDKKIICINWRFVIQVLRVFEFFKIKLRFSVDSIIGLVYSVKTPENNLYE